MDDVREVSPRVGRAALRERPQFPAVAGDGYRAEIVLPAAGVAIVEPNHQLGPAREARVSALIIRAEPDVVRDVVLIARRAAGAERPAAGQALERAHLHR